MRNPAKQKNRTEEMPLHIMAEKALREAVADAMAEHKRRGHPIIVWRDGKVVSIPPEMIPVTSNGNESSDWRKPEQLSVKEKNQPYRKIKRQSK